MIPLYSATTGAAVPHKNHGFRGNAGTWKADAALTHGCEIGYNIRVAGRMAGHAWSGPAPGGFETRPYYMEEDETC